MAISSLFNDNNYSLFCENLTVTGTVVVPCLNQTSNEGGGVQIYDEGTCGSLRTLEGTANGLTVTETGETITIDNTLTCTNLAPSGPTVGQIFAAKSGSVLEMRSIVAGLNITLNETPSGIEISTSGVSSISGAANEGGGAGLYDTIVGTTLTFRSIVGTANGVTVTQDPTTVTVDNTLTGANLGAGSQLFSAKSGASLQFRSLTAGANIALTQNANDVSIAATGVLTALANQGSGAQVYDTGTTSTLRTLLGTGNGVTVTQGATSITVDNTLTGTNLGSGANVFGAKSGAALQFRSLLGTANGLTVTQGANDITVDNTLTVDSVGTGVPFFVAKSGDRLQFRGLAVGTGGLSIVGGANLVTIDNTLDGVNLGTGARVFDGKSGSSLQFRSLTAGSNISLTENANDIVLSASISQTMWVITEEQPSGVNAMFSVTFPASMGPVSRWLNTAVSYGPSTANLARTTGANSNVSLTIQPGTYFVRGSAPTTSAWNINRVVLRNTLAGTNLIIGTISGASTTAFFINAEVVGIITITVPNTTLELYHYKSNTSSLSVAFGQPLGIPSQPEVYTCITFSQLA